ncbi:hypothetical protein, partial [Bacteroides congonensis]|uniref:hypothetical protein n=1 Tax=Bacteroides congonensis TaxID=1871006 RepID=UPI0025A39A9A
FRKKQMEQEEKFHNEQAERDEQSRKEQLAEQKKDRYIRIGIADRTYGAASVLCQDLSDGI